MKVRFSSPQKEHPDRDGGMIIPYGSGKRTVSRWRWSLLVLIISSPLLFLLWRVGSTLFFISAPGVVSLDKVSINSPFAAVVGNILAVPGMSVIRGETLMHLDDPLLNQRASVLGAELDALKTGNSVNLDDRSTRIAADKVRLAEQNLRYQTAYRDSVRSLFEQGAATRPEMDAAEDRYRQAQSVLVEARGAAVSLHVPAFYQQESAAQRNNRIAQIEAELKTLEERRALFSVVSPGEGRILDVFVAEGQMLAGGAPLVLMGRPQSLKVMAYLQPRLLSYAAPGEKVSIRFPNGLSVPGRVMAAPELAVRIPAELSGVLSEGKQTLLVKINFEDSLDSHLQVEGLPVSVHFGFSLLKSIQFFLEKF